MNPLQDRHTERRQLSRCCRGLQISKAWWGGCHDMDDSQDDRVIPGQQADGEGGMPYPGTLVASKSPIGGV